jgi:hypothetical protein
MAERLRPIGKGPPGPDAEVTFELTAFSAVDGGPRYVLFGYRPQYVVKPDYQTSVAHQFLGVDRVWTGERVKAEVWFISPEAYPHSLWEGRRIEIAEGARRVGVATVLKVLNPLLAALTLRAKTGREQMQQTAERAVLFGNSIVNSDKTSAAYCRKRTIGTAARIIPINLYTEIPSIIAAGKDV